MTNPVQILGPDGFPLPPRTSRTSALAGGGNAPYDAADIYGQHMESWRPYLWSPDTELNMYRDRMVARVRDLVRNDGWASGAVTRILDNAVGASFRPISKPDYRALAMYSGNSAFDATWADEFGRAVEARWRVWSDDPGRYCDAGRRLTLAQQLRVAFRHLIVDGDALAILLYLPERVGPGRGHYATTVQLIDPDRLSNPQLAFDQQSLRGGVEIDQYGAATAYWIRKAHQADWYDAANSVTWEKVPRETDWGRPIVVHYFDSDRASQHRGGAGVLTPVLQRLKMLIRYDGTELDAAIINAIFAAYIESPYDPSVVGAALGEEDLSVYQNERADYHKERRTNLNGARIPLMFPGEKINAVTAARPATNFAAFEKAVLRNAASGIGISAQQLSNDWSDVNYSSARAALLEAWKTITRRRQDFAAGFATPIYAGWLEEAMDVACELPLPNGVVPEFLECRGSYSRCRWMGPGRGWVDPVAEKQGAVLGMDAALSTLEDECAEQGLDWEEVLDQRGRELKAFADRGIPAPSWAAMNIPAGKSAQPPQKPEAA